MLLQLVSVSNHPSQFDPSSTMQAQAQSQSQSIAAVLGRGVGVSVLCTPLWTLSVRCARIGNDVKIEANTNELVADY